MLRACLVAGFVFIWSSVVVIPLGTYLVTGSPRYEEYKRQAIGPTENWNRAGLLGLDLSFTWPFLGCDCFFIGLLFTGGVLILRALARSIRDLSLLAAGAFSLACLYGTFLGLGEALAAFVWGLAVLGIGYLLSAAGLALGAMSSAGHCLTSKWSQESRSRTPNAG